MPFVTIHVEVIDAVNLHLAIWNGTWYFECKTEASISIQIWRKYMDRWTNTPRTIIDRNIVKFACVLVTTRNLPVIRPINMGEVQLGDTYLRRCRVWGIWIFYISCIWYQGIHTCQLFWGKMPFVTIHVEVIDAVNLHLAIWNGTWYFECKTEASISIQIWRKYMDRWTNTPRTIIDRNIVKFACVLVTTRNLPVIRPINMGEVQLGDTYLRRRRVWGIWIYCKRFIWN